MRTSRIFQWSLLGALCLGACLGCGSPTSVQSDHAGTAQTAGPSTGLTSSAPATSSSTAPGAIDPAPKASATDAEMAAAAKGDSEFALALYARVKGTGNVLLSPASARIALAMTYAGAKGATAAQMARVLAIPNDPGTHEAFGAILGQWQSWAGVQVPSSPEMPRQPFTLRVANRIFGQKDRAFLPAFLTLLTDEYAAPLEKVDFKTAPEPSRVHINEWVEDHTEKRIKDLLPQGSVTPDTRLVLANALYFKADWADPFDKAQTHDDDFFTTPATKVKVPTMVKTSYHRYAETADAQILEMPYLGAPVAMTIVLPTAKDGLDRLERALTPAVLDGWTAKLASTNERVAVRLPKVKIESEFRLVPTLAALGMTDAVDQKKADFSGIDGTRELFIGEVVQKTFCIVDEKGTEAAAATAVAARLGAAAHTTPPKSFTADHPFLFMIRDTKTGSLLFLGRFAKPG